MDHATWSRLACANALLDGEVIAENEKGVSDFARLTDDLSRGDDSAIAYCIFDLLFFNGEDLRDHPLLERRARLKALLGTTPPRPLRFSLHQQGDGAGILKDACGRGFEGVVSKVKSSRYTSDRAGSWIKTKCVDRQEFIIGGFTPSTAIKDAVGALVLGVRERRKLRYAGRAGTGFTHESARTLFGQLKVLVREKPPLAAELMSRALRDVF